MNHKTLLKIINDKAAKIGVIGLGYVGLPLAVTFANKGFLVTGFDVDPKKIDQLTKGRSYIKHIENNIIKQHISSKALTVSYDFSSLGEMSAIIICVPTPLNDIREPDLSYLDSTSRTIASRLRIGQLVVLESTTYPGCCEEVVKPILEESGLTSSKDFYLAYSPEREDPGNPKFVTASIPKVIGADGQKALEVAKLLYDQIVVETVPVSSMDVAEAVKLTENIFRSVNIALMNELKVIYEKMGIDVWEVIEAAETKPFGYMPFYPGPGLGGHCIPIDPFYLSWRAKQVGEKTRFIELAGEINTAMPQKVIETLSSALKKRFNKNLFKANILLLGLAYKKNVDDTRESPALVLIEQLENRGAMVDYFDPYVQIIPKTRNHSQLAGRKSIDWSPKTFTKYDAALICTDHDGLNYADLVNYSRLVVDTRNAIGRIPLYSEKVEKA
ncbi:nucleotide sugar dehydrogenase [Rhodospirillales bacterium]|nr:nucleotide sugar dehydrogenase [Rhodospirillales bacterium]